MENITIILPVLAVIGFIYMFIKSSWVSKQEVGTEKMAHIAKHIADGAMAFLKAEYKVLAFFVLAVAVLLIFKGNSEEHSTALVALSFVVGALMSALAGYIGMRVATKANVRTTNAARTSLNKALEVAFSGGAVMGLGVVSLGVFGLSVLFLIYSKIYGVDTISNLTTVLNV
jgi:K(+)-stimulated pyrophosphate-energized sodium pump